MPTDLPDLRIDLGDPASIRERLPGVEEIVAAKRRVAQEAEQDLEVWDTLLKRLRSVAGLIVRIDKPAVALPHAVPTAALEAVVQVIEREGERMMPIAVEEALKAEGHEVEGRNAVYAVLMAAVAAGRIQQVAPRRFAPNPPDRASQEEPVLKAVPEAHLGLDGPPPQSKAEAAVRVLASDPSRSWSIPDVGREMVGQGWMTDSESDLASLASTLSRLVSDGKIFRPQRGFYRLGPPGMPSG
jgi:hypothetical protein